MEHSQVCLLLSIALLLLSVYTLYKTKESFATKVISSRASPKSLGKKAYTPGAVKTAPLTGNFKAQTVGYDVM